MSTIISIKNTVVMHIYYIRCSYIYENNIFNACAWHCLLYFIDCRCCKVENVSEKSARDIYDLFSHACNKGTQLLLDIDAWMITTYKCKAWWIIKLFPLVKISSNPDLSNFLHKSLKTSGMEKSCEVLSLRFSLFLCKISSASVLCFSLGKPN